jgi:cytochrome c biogenesis protein CcmG, thiol:disulfide interchange protein DsbE
MTLCKITGSIVVLLLCAGCSDDTGSVRRPAPEFVLALLDGSDFRLSDHQGAPVLINFFASWCAPCVEEAPVIEAVYREYRQKGVAFLAVAINDEPEKARQFLDKHGLSFPAGIDLTGKVQEAYGVYGLPTTIFIDSQGITNYLHPGSVTERLLKHELDKLL